jgi:uncharacterized protein YndB with AHSA1/START domain
MTQSSTGDLTIVREIDIKAPAARVFAAISDPDELIQWWGDGDSYRCTAMESDLRVGGAWRTTGISKNGEPFAVHGTYTVVDPPSVLEYTWNYDWSTRDSPETLVRYELTEREGTTRLRLIHSGFVDREGYDGHNDGWERVFSWLTAYVER